MVKYVARSLIVVNYLSILHNRSFVNVNVKINYSLSVTNVTMRSDVANKRIFT